MKQTWMNPRHINIKAASIITACGYKIVTIGSYSLGKCVGFIDLGGDRIDGDTTSLIIGFTRDPSQLKEPTFHYDDETKDAAGTLTLLAEDFGVTVALLARQETMMTIGGSGWANGLFNSYACKDVTIRVEDDKIVVGRG